MIDKATRELEASRKAEDNKEEKEVGTEVTRLAVVPRICCISAGNIDLAPAIMDHARPVDRLTRNRSENRRVPIYPVNTQGVAVRLAGANG